MQSENKSTEKLLREIVAAYKATQDHPLGAKDHIKHLRLQIARLARVCIEMNARIKELELRQEIQLGSTNENGKKENKKEEETDVQITALGDVW